jgi:hypothetical protein
MLSDVLSDTMESIKEYRDATTEPDRSWYGDLAEEINVVIGTMDALREYLDGSGFADDSIRRPTLRRKLGLPGTPPDLSDWDNPSGPGLLERNGLR